MKKHNEKLPSDLSENFGVKTILKGNNRDYVVFIRDRFVSAPPHDGILIEANKDFVVWGFKAKLTRAFMVRSWANKKLIEILRNKTK